MMRNFTILALVGLSFSISACAKPQARADEPLVEEPPAKTGNAAYLEHAGRWLPADTVALAAVSTAPLWNIMREGFPSEERSTRFDAFVADLGATFEARAGLDLTKIDGVVVGYGESWSTLLLFGSFGIDGLQAQKISVGTHEAYSFDLGSGARGVFTPLDEGIPGYAVFLDESQLAAAVEANAGDGTPLLADADDRMVRQMLDELPAAPIAMAASLTDGLRAAVAGKMQGMAPDHIAIALGESAAVVMRGEQARLDALDDFVTAYIEQAAATLKASYDARDNAPTPEAITAITSYHYFEAYIESLQVERGDGVLAYRAKLPTSQLGIAVPGLAAAIAIPAYQRYLVRSKATEAQVRVDSIALQAIAQFEQTRAVSGVGAFPGGANIKVLSHADPPSSGEKFPVRPVAETGAVDPAVIFSDFGIDPGYPMYFQYTYETRGAGPSQMVIITAKADFKPGGPMHTVVIEIELDPETGAPSPTPPMILNDGE